MPIILGPSQATAANNQIIAHANMYMGQSQILVDVINNHNLRVELTNGATQVIDRGGGSIIQWNPKSAMIVQTFDGSLAVQSAVAGLVHEIIHVVFGLNGNSSMTQAQIDEMEQKTTELETILLLAIGEPTRVKYTDAVDVIMVDNPTLHTTGYQWKQMSKDGKIFVDNYTGNPYVIPDLNAMPPIDIGSGGGGAGGDPIPDPGGLWVPGGIPIVDPSIPKTPGVDVIPGAKAPPQSGGHPPAEIALAFGGGEILSSGHPTTPPATESGDEVILIGPIVLPPPEMYSPEAVAPKKRKPAVAGFSFETVRISRGAGSSAWCSCRRSRASARRC